jgi:hypothetical protein
MEQIMERWTPAPYINPFYIYDQNVRWKEVWKDGHRPPYITHFTFTLRLKCKMEGSMERWTPAALHPPILHPF